MPGKTVDGNDVDQVYNAVGEAVARARSGEGPSLIDAKTYRLWGHWIGDPDDYRSREEVEKEWRRDPLETYERKLIAENVLNENEIGKINADAKTHIDRAVTAMQTAKALRPESALEDVFAN
jgi:pyruvate dehydrogenase E1 component alpha subunit